MSKNVKYFDLKAKTAKFVESVRKKVIPSIWGEFTEKVFVAETFGGKKWTARNKADKNPKKRNLLVKTGSLRANAINAKATAEKVFVTIASTKYGVHHNEGDKPQPKRQFLGRDEKLLKKILSGIKTQFKKDFK